MPALFLPGVAFFGIALLLFLIIKVRVHPFISLLIVSVVVALMSGIPHARIMNIIGSGIGGLLSHIAIIIVLGAMLGLIIQHSGGAEVFARKLTHKMGVQHAVAALTLAGFLVAIPISYEVGYIIIMPLIYGFAKVLRVSPVHIGLPVGGVMLALHVAVPTHPGPAATAGLLGADMGMLSLVGLGVAVPVGIAGFFISRIINRRHYALSVEVLQQVQLSKEEASTSLDNSDNVPGSWAILFLLMLPIFLFIIGTTLKSQSKNDNGIISFIAMLGEPSLALLISVLFAGVLLGRKAKWSREELEKIVSRAIPACAGVLVVAGAGGAFGKVLVESGIGHALAASLQHINLPIIPAAYLITLILRASQGSATVSIITTSGLLTQAVAGLDSLHVVLVALAAGFGGLGVSHVNDAGFWVVTRYLGLSVADGLKTWTLLTTLMGLVGFLIVWAIWLIV
ncbi:GntP family transporter [Cedecea neteri]|uniref:GntP family transporter n=1 Tax=Cedecea neteri TaxID=158822 RepID=UPI002892C842|nr:GntP family transporter [Cedecea neteri]WNJ78024.1 GntP family transporter [Cedecea neteri]